MNIKYARAAKQPLNQLAMCHVLSDGLFSAVSELHTLVFFLQGEYHMYVAQTPHIDPLMLHLALQQNAETDAVDGAEKTAFAW